MIFNERTHVLESMQFLWTKQNPQIKFLIKLKSIGIKIIIFLFNLNEK